jgi:copper resistance protein B
MRNLAFVRTFQKKSNRTYAVFGTEGLAPGFIEIDADGFVSQRGEVSGEVTTFYDLLITNRLILQPRIDVELQMQRVPDLDLSSGITVFELGARLRYEFTRNVAPYIGSTGIARSDRRRQTIARNNGEAVSSVSMVAGARLFW